MRLKAWLSSSSLIGVGKNAWYNALGAGCLLLVGGFTYALGPAVLATTLLISSLVLWWLSAARRPPVNTGDPSGVVHHAYVLPSKPWRRVCRISAVVIAVGGASVLGYSAWQRSAAKASATRELVEDVERIDDTTARSEDKLDQVAKKLEELDRRLKNAGENASLSEADLELLAQARVHADAKTRARAAIIARDFDEADRLIAQVEARAEGELFDALTLRGNRHYYADEFNEAIEPFEKALSLRPDDVDARNNTALAHNQARLGSIERHQRRAIELYQGTLTIISIEAHPLDWAMTQNNLGVAWGGLPTGDRGVNIKNAIGCYSAALEVRTREAHPVEWATTQNNLGNAWQVLPTGDRGENIEKAIGCYTDAQEVHTREAHPVEWATTQNNLGNAWRVLPTGDRGENIEKAIGCFTAALEVYTREAHPADWAMMQNNLGVAWGDLPTGDRGENIEKAIGCYTAALEVRTREAHPVEWATTQHNLATALADLAYQPGRDRCGLLRDAIANGKGALTVYTQGAMPRNHERTMKLLTIIEPWYDAAGCSPPFDEIEPAG